MKRAEKLNITREKLIEATLELMKEENDPVSVTSRAITAKAGVQLAMINYCFGSREELIVQAFKRLDPLNDPQLRKIFASDDPAKEKIRKLFYVVTEYLVKEYRFTKEITSHILLNRNLAEGLHSLPLVIEHFGGRKSEEECKIIAYDLTSMMQLIVYRKDDIKDYLGLDPNVPEELKKIVDIQIDMMLGDA